MAILPSSLESGYLYYGVATFAIGYVFSIVIYRRFFHPLAKVPGPFLPSVTAVYATFFIGTYYKKIDEWHRIYGPIVRINPNEVHLTDHEHYEKIYRMGSRYEKSANFYGAFCIPHSTFTTPTDEVHKRKRGALNPMFSRRMVLNLEEVVQDKARRAVRLMAAGIEAKKPVDLHHTFRAVSVDVVTEYAFNKSYEFLDSPDLGIPFFETVRGLGPAMYIFQAFEPLQALALRIPPWLAPYLSPPLGHVMRLQAECAAEIEDTKLRMSEGKLSTTRPTIFSELLNPKYNDGQVPPTHELKDEAYSVLGAAADTTGNALATATYHVLANPEIYAKLRTELLAAFPDPTAQLDWVSLERLPYLTGVIKEGLRMSYPVTSRLARIVPEPGATFNGFFIPAGTQIGMSMWQQHRKPVFVDSEKFSPERWLTQDKEQFRQMESHLMAFGGGNRQCVGISLAYCELYVTLGTFFHRFEGLQIYDTPLEYFDYDDFFASHCHGKLFQAIGPA